MKIFDSLIKFFTGRVSDEEFEQILNEEEAIQCPNCGLFMTKDTWIDEGFICVKCKTQISMESLNKQE